MRGSASILVSWVGHADLLTWAVGLPPPNRAKIEAAVGKSTPKDGAPGPLRAAMGYETYDEIHLLADSHVPSAREFGEALGKPACVHEVSLKSPIDYLSVFSETERVLQEICASKKVRPRFWFNLSSGTPAMAATLLLLGKTRFPARFMQSYRGQADEVDVPFDLTLDCLPELLREPDATLQVLADRTPAEIPGFDAIVGESKAIRLAVGRAKKSAIRDVSVLIFGESGVGKELFARAMHEASHRRNAPFVAINCAGIPRELQASTLFGHKKGAFTGAGGDAPGAFHEANCGTLFLDEFGELDLSAQALVLRALQPLTEDPPCLRRIRRVGAQVEEALDVRIVAATNRSPRDAVAEGRLRPDLYYRVATIVLRVPPLRERRSDIPAIVDAILSRINASFQKTEPGYEHKTISSAARAFVVRQEWRGNVRELNNVLVQAAVMCPGAIIGKADIEAALIDAGEASGDNAETGVPLGDGFALQAHLEAIHRRYLERARHEANGIKTKAARLLGLKSYQTLDAQLRRLGVPWESPGT